MNSTSRFSFIKSSVIATLLASALSACGEGTSPTSSSPASSSLRIEINRQTDIIDSEVSQVRVVLYADSALEQPLGNTGNLTFSSPNSTLFGSINNIPPGIYVLQCLTLDSEGETIARGNIVPVDVSSGTGSAEVRCNVLLESQPIIEINNLPSTLPIGEVVTFEIVATAGEGRTIQDVSLQNFGINVIPPFTFVECTGLQQCITLGSYTAGTIEQLLRTVWTVVDSEGQAASVAREVLVVDGIVNPSPSPSLIPSPLPSPSPLISPSPSPSPTLGVVILSNTVLAQASASNIQIVIVGGGLAEDTLIVLPASTIDYEFTLIEGSNQVFTSGLDNAFEITPDFNMLGIPGIAPGTEVLVRSIDGDVLASGIAE